MGIEINKTSFADQDYLRFKGRLEENLTALQQLLADPGFGCGKT